jgi:hypothetical protein
MYLSLFGGFLLSAGVNFDREWMKRQIGDGDEQVNELKKGPGALLAPVIPLDSLAELLDAVRIVISFAQANIGINKGSWSNQTARIQDGIAASLDAIAKDCS